MTANQIIFYFLSVSVLLFGFLSVTTRQIFRSAIYLLFSLVGIAGFYFLLEFEFVAAVQIVVYVGGIVVLIIFAVFLTHKAGENMAFPKASRELAAFVAVFLGFALTFLIINKEVFYGSQKTMLEPSVENIGKEMLDTQHFGFVLPFEIVSILLLAAMIGAIVIAIKIKTDHTEQLPK